MDIHQNHIVVLFFRLPENFQDFISVIGLVRGNPHLFQQSAYYFHIGVFVFRNQRPFHEDFSAGGSFFRPVARLMQYVIAIRFYFHEYRCAGAAFRLNPHGTLQLLCQISGQNKAETASLRFFFPPFPSVSLPSAGEKLFFHADSRIRYFQQKPDSFFLPEKFSHTACYLPAVFRIFHRVGNQIDHNLLYGRPVQIQIAVYGFPADKPYPDIPFLRFVSKNPLRIFYQVFQRNRFDCSPAPVFQLGNAQRTVYQIQKMFRGKNGIVQISVFRSRFFTQHFQITVNTVKRRSDFMNKINNPFPQSIDFILPAAGYGTCFLPGFHIGKKSGNVFTEHYDIFFLFNGLFIKIVSDKGKFFMICTIFEL